jgi:hypothetical protein
LLFLSLELLISGLQLSPSTLETVSLKGKHKK